MSSCLPTRNIGISEQRVIQRFAQQFVHLWDDAQSAPRKRKSFALWKAAIALTLLRDACKALGLLETELELQYQRSNFDLAQLLMDLREAVGAMHAKLKWREAIGVDVNKYKALDLLNPSFKPPTAKEWNKAVRIAGVKMAGGHLDTSRSFAFRREWIETLRKAANRLPKAPLDLMATPAVSPQSELTAAASSSQPVAPEKIGHGQSAAASTAADANKCTKGIAYVVTAHQQKRRLTIKGLAEHLGANRSALYENAEFSELRDIANKLFGLFGRERKQGDWDGTRQGEL
jgi:hypothetical protein